MGRFFTGIIFGFIGGMTYGLYNTVEVSEGKMVKTIAFIKAVIEAMSQ